MEPLYITRDEVAALLRCSERTVLRRVDPKFPPDRTTCRPPSASGWLVVQEGGAGAEIIDYLGAPMLQLPGNLTFPCTPA